MGANNSTSVYNDVDLSQYATKQELHAAAAAWSAGYTPKGPASVSTINGLTGQQNGDVYILTDSGTVNPGALTVSSGDQIAWSDSSNTWYPFTEYGLKSVQEELVFYQNIDNLTRELAQQKGFIDCIHFKWESGSINYPSGTDHIDLNVIRTPLPRFQFKDKIRFILLNNKYRIRYYTFSATTGDATDRSVWYTTAGEYEINLDTSLYYRVQIATNTAENMDKAEALQSILIVYEYNKIDYLNKKEYVLFSNSQTWENGSINTANGNNAVDTVSIRYSGKQYLNGDVKIVFLKDTYRVRFFYYQKDGTFEGSSGWITSTSTERENPYNINKNYLYRIQISTYNILGDIDINDALNSIKLYFTQCGVSFWKSYLDSRINTINSLLTDGSSKSVFLFLTDTHWNESPNYLNHYGINAELMRYVSDKCNIGILIHGGDLNSEYRSDKNIARQLMTEPVSIMRSVFENVLLTRGNHDDNIEGTGNVWDYVITQADSYSYMFRGTKNVNFGSTGTYFYQDIKFEKIRIISLDCVDFPYKNTVDPDKSDLKILAYGYEQLQWLCNVLEETPEDYNIVIYTHAMLAPSIVTIDHPLESPQTRAKDYLILCDILKAYKNRSSFTYSMDGSFVNVHKEYYTGTIEADFTQSSAYVVGVFSGHEHVDCIEEILDSDGVGIGIYNTCTQNSSALFSNEVISNTYQHPMQIGTISELVWDVVIIDRKNKGVSMVRIGASEANTDVSVVDVRTFNYT